jgi:hypothetical protein
VASDPTGRTAESCVGDGTAAEGCDGAADPAVAADGGGLVGAVEGGGAPHAPIRAMTKSTTTLIGRLTCMAASRPWTLHARGVRGKVPSRPIFGSAR